jgi:hypothetical protein
MNTPCVPTYPQTCNRGCELHTSFKEDAALFGQLDFEVCDFVYGFSVTLVHLVYFNFVAILKIRLRDITYLFYIQISYISY